MGVSLNSIKRVGIVGAGPAGLTLANALEQAGFAVTVYEQASKFERVGAGIQLGANATSVIAGIGLLSDLTAVGMLPEVGQAYEWNTGSKLTRSVIGASKYDSPYVQIHRADLHSVLVGGLKRTDVRNGAKLVNFTEHDSGVDLRFEDGSSDTVDVLVGADGIHSIVREGLFGYKPAQFSGWASHRGMVDAAAVEDLDLEVVAAKWMGPDRHVIHYFVSPTELTFIAVLPQEAASIESWSRESDRDELLAALPGFHTTIHELVRRAHTINKWAIFDRDALFTWSRGRVTLMGDAAHPMRPFMAQGGSTAIEDAGILARALRGDAGSGTLLEALAVYELNRKPRATWIQSVSRTHGFRRPENNDPESPSAAEYVYSYDAWTEPLRTPAVLRAANETSIAHGDKAEVPA